MAFKLSVTVRNGRLDCIESSIGANAVLKIRTGAPPANISDADSGTVLATLNLPADWMSPAAGGVVTKAGSWIDLSVDLDGTAGHFRIYASDGTTQHIQGTVTVTGGGGDMTVNTVSFLAGQTFTVTGFTITDGNA